MVAVRRHLSWVIAGWFASQLALEMLRRLLLDASRAAGAAGTAADADQVAQAVESLWR